MIDLPPPPPLFHTLVFLSLLSLDFFFSFTAGFCLFYLFTCQCLVYFIVSPLFVLLFLPHCCFIISRAVLFSSSSSRICTFFKLFFSFMLTLFHFCIFLFFSSLSHSLYLVLCLIVVSVAILCPCQSLCLRDIPDIITAFDYPPD